MVITQISTCQRLLLERLSARKQEMSCKTLLKLANNSFKVWSTVQAHNGARAGNGAHGGTERRVGLAAGDVPCQQQGGDVSCHVLTRLCSPPSYLARSPSAKCCEEQVLPGAWGRGFPSCCVSCRNCSVPQFPIHKLNTSLFDKKLRRNSFQ